MTKKEKETLLWDLYDKYKSHRVELYKLGNDGKEPEQNSDLGLQLASELERCLDFTSHSIDQL